MHAEAETGRARVRDNDAHLEMRHDTPDILFEPHIYHSIRFVHT